MGVADPAQIITIHATPLYTERVELIHAPMLHRCTQTSMEKRWQRRDRKRKAKEKNARMRGGRSVFEIAKAVHKRAKHATPLDTEERKKRKKGRPDV